MKLTELLVEKATKIDVIKFAQSRKNSKQGTVWGGLIGVWGGYGAYSPGDNESGDSGSDAGGDGGGD